MKPFDVKPSTYINFNHKINNKNPKFKIVDIVRTSKYKNIFAKGNVPDWFESVFVIRKVRNTMLWTYIISDINEEEIVGTSYEKKLQKAHQKEFRVVKLIKQVILIKQLD